jgi:hypothetical protein
MRRIWLISALWLAACSSEGASGASGGAIVDGAAGSPGADGAMGGSGGGLVDASGETDGPIFTGPEQLADTGLYDDIAAKALAPGVLEYSVRFPLWSDGADKRRFLVLPADSKIDTSWMDVWTFPIGTKAFKEFSLNGKPIETRMLAKNAEGPGGWMMVSYLWNQAGTQAIAVPAGVTNALGTTHDVPSQEQCDDCHGGVGDVLVGVSAIQLSTDQNDGWLSKLAALGFLSDPPDSEFPAPGEGVVQDALGYLHGNCGQCHNGQHYLASKRALRLKLTVSATTPEQTPTYTTAINAPMSHVIEGTTLAIVPGAPQQSQIWQRIKRRDDYGMPPTGTELVDLEAVQTITEWIAKLSP